MILSDGEAKAVVAGAKPVDTALQLFGSVGTYLKDTLGTIPSDLLGISGGDWLHEQRARNLASMQAKTERHLEKVARERLQEPSVSLVLPLMQAAADERQEQLQELWAALLANAMVDDGRKVRRAFFDVVRQMDPADVLVLREVPQVEMPPNLFDSPGTRRTKLAEQLVSALSEDEVFMSSDNLVRLGCITSNPNFFELTALGRGLLKACTVD